MATVVGTEWRYLGNADSARWEQIATSAANNSVPALIAAATALSALYSYEKVFSTASRCRSKKTVMALTLLSAWYGCSLQQRREMASCVPTAAAVRDRLTLLGLSSGGSALLISIIQYWNKKRDKNLPLAHKKRQKIPKLRQHLLWATEVAAVHMLAAMLGYQFNYYRMG